MVAEKDFFEQPDERREFCLLVEGSKVYVCREYLACHSPVFEKIFFRESFKKQPEDGMLMEGKNLAEFLTFLHAVCPSPIVGKVSDAGVAVLLAYADEYDMADLRERCVEFIVKRLCSANLSQALSLEAVLTHAEQYNLKVVRDTATERMGSWLSNGTVTDTALVDYLKLAVQYDFGPLKQRLVPLVAQLPADQIKASHSSLPTAVLAAVYESKWMHAEHVVSVWKLEEKSQPASPEETGFTFGNRASIPMMPQWVAPRDERKRCKTCKKRVANEPSTDAPAAKCMCRYADFSADLLDRQ